MSFLRRAAVGCVRNAHTRVSASKRALPLILSQLPLFPDWAQPSIRLTGVENNAKKMCGLFAEVKLARMITVAMPSPTIPHWLQQARTSSQGPNGGDATPYAVLDMQKAADDHLGSTRIWTRVANSTFEGQGWLERGVLIT